MQGRTIRIRDIGLPRYIFFQQYGMILETVWRQFFRKLIKISIKRMGKKMQLENKKTVWSNNNP
jgi:hypothetical protein